MNVTSIFTSSPSFGDAGTAFDTEMISSDGTSPPPSGETGFAGARLLAFFTMFESVTCADGTSLDTTTPFVPCNAVSL